jgi:hypothetical protein
MVALRIVSVVYICQAAEGKSPLHLSTPLLGVESASLNHKYVLLKLSPLFRPLYCHSIAIPSQEAFGEWR